MLRRSLRRSALLILRLKPAAVFSKPIPTTSPFFRTLSQTPSSKTHAFHPPRRREPQFQSDDDDDDGWEDDEEEDEDKDPEIGDGRDGGGVVLGGVDWGENALNIAKDVLRSHFRGGDLKIFAFRVSPRGYVYVRLDKISHEYGCPSMDEIEKYNRLYHERLEECGDRGEIPDCLAVEVSSPGALRLLKVPDEFERFKNLPMVVNYLEEDVESKVIQPKEGAFYLDSMDSEAGSCTWKLADVKENRDPQGKGKRLSKKLKVWRVSVPFTMIKKVTLHI